MYGERLALNCITCLRRLDDDVVIVSLTFGEYLRYDSPWMECFWYTAFRVGFETDPVVGGVSRERHLPECELIRIHMAEPVGFLFFDTLFLDHQ